MYSKREGTELIDPFIPASSADGRLLDKEGSEYKALYKGQNPLDFNFFEASSIRQVGNKYVMVFSGYSGKEYGLGNTNSALRYAFGDSPLGPLNSSRPMLLTTPTAHCRKSTVSGMSSTTVLPVASAMPVRPWLLL